MKVEREFLGCAECGKDTTVLVRSFHGGNIKCAECEAKDEPGFFAVGVAFHSTDVQKTWETESLPAQMKQFPNRYFTEVIA